MHEFICFLFLANVFSLSVGVEYKFNFKPTLGCRVENITSWSFNLRYFEYGTLPLNGPDPITDYVIQRNITVEDTTLNIWGTLDGDEPYSAAFDVHVHIYHTCNPTNKDMLIKYQLRPFFPILTDEHDMLYVFSHNAPVANRDDNHLQEWGNLTTRILYDN